MFFCFLKVCQAGMLIRHYVVSNLKDIHKKCSVIRKIRKDTMERIKCTCGETKVFVEIRNTCDGCPKNGFYVDFSVVRELGVEEDIVYSKSGFYVDFSVMRELGIEEDVVYYDENLSRKVEERINKDIILTESKDSGECSMGSNCNSGCYTFVCSSCGRNIDFIALKDGC